MAVLSVAKLLGKFAWEVEEQCPPHELADWIAFSELEVEVQTKAQTKARRANANKHR